MSEAEMIVRTEEMSLTIDWIALAISVLAIVVAILTAFAQSRGNKKINDINLTAVFCKDIFQEFIVEKIPNAINKIYFPDNKLSGIESLQTELNNLRKKTQFFTFLDPTFYEGLKKECQTLEDYLVVNKNKEFTLAEHGNVSNTILKHVEKIYSLLNQKFTNG